MKHNLFLVLFLIFSFQGFSQIPFVNNSCFCVEESNNSPSILYEYIVDLQEWITIGNIVYSGNIPQNAENIEAIAINPVENIIYAFDGGKFGKIKIGTNEFELINTNLKGNGIIKGTIINNFTFGNIDGLTYNLYTRELWATNRLNGNNINDILFKINPETGEVIKGIFDGFDFVEIEESFDGTIGGLAYDVEDVAINPFTNQLFAIQNQNFPGSITEINKTDGSIEQMIYDLNEDNIKGLGFTGYGYLYGTTGDNSDFPSPLIAIDFVNFSTQSLSPIDLSLPNGTGNFESFDCISDYVDLALDAKIKTAGQTFAIGDKVEIEVNVYNQGTIEIDYLQIAMHLPGGVNVSSPGWINAGGGQTYIFDINDSFLNSNEINTTSVELIIDNPTINFNTVAFEISKARNNIISTGQGYSIDLPDVDSKPDLINQEVNIKDNEINEDGVFGSNEDEDDHDIATFEFLQNNVNCPSNLILPTIDKTFYNAANSIYTTAIVPPNFSVEMYAGQEITFDDGFSVSPGASLIANIRSCDIPQ